MASPLRYTVSSLPGRTCTAAPTVLELQGHRRALTYVSRVPTGTAAAATFAASAAACLAAGLAIVGIAHFGRAATLMGAPGGSPAVMVPATALGICLCAGALPLAGSSRPSLRSVARLLAASSATLGGIVVARYVADAVDVGATAASSAVGAWWARPSPTTGASLALLGSALLALAHGSRRARRWVDVGAGAALLIALAALVGHAYGASVLYAINHFGGMAWSTATGILTLALGTLCADPARGLAALVLSGSAGGRLVRRLAPAALIAPFVLGWLALRVEAAGLADPAHGTALLVVALTVVTVGLVVQRAVALHTFDVERERLLAAERAARVAREREHAALERVTESRTRLMRGFSHDVKNPLGAADGHAALLEEGLLGTLTERQGDSVRRIRRSIATSLRLIHDLLELAHAEAGQLEVECVPTDLGTVARDVAEDFQAQAATAGLTIERRAPDGVVAETDPTRVRQILANLLSNAVKYAPQGTVTIDVAVRDAGGPRPGAWAAVCVTDTGRGIAPADRERIFQEFTRLDPEAQPGAGIGLAISRRIAQRLGGDLTVASEVGRGATFTLWLPRPATSDSAGPLD